MKTSLTIEQSQNIIDHGLSRDLASNFFEGHNGNPCYIFDLTDLLDILPKCIDVNGGGGYVIRCHLTTIALNEAEWTCYYMHGESIWGWGCAPELIDALYSLLLWCLDEGYLKTEQ